MDKINIKIILGSIRDKRFGIHPAEWIAALAKAEEGMSVELLDLRDYMLPIFQEPVPPSQVKAGYTTPEINRWAEKVREADGFIIVTPEYNHGYSSALKNNIDYLDKEWHKKPIAFVSYGTNGGVRAAEQLRQVAVELQMAPIRAAVHISSPWNLLEQDGSLKPGALDGSERSAKSMLAQLLWWAKALKQARDQK